MTNKYQKKSKNKASVGGGGRMAKLIKVNHGILFGVEQKRQ